MTRVPAPKAVLFDLFHTLANVPPPATVGEPTLPEILGIPSAEFQRHYYDEDTLGRCVGRIHDDVEAMRLIARSIDPAVTEERILAAVASRRRRFEHALVRVETPILAALVAYASAGAEIKTPRLNQVLKDALAVNPPPVVRGRQVRLRYAHQGGRYPPLVVVYGNQAQRLPAHYKRYLENSFREALKLRGTPVRIELREGENPYAGKRNVLTPRQAKNKRRMLRFKHKKD